MQSENLLDNSHNNNLNDQYNLNPEIGRNLHWMHGLEEYLKYIKHHQVDTFVGIKRALMYGNIWKIRNKC